MRFHTFLLKYGEIGIKGKNRHLFEDALVRQVRYALKDVGRTVRCTQITGKNLCGL